jgi:hypothetical protein
MALEEGSEERCLLQALIQLANAQLKLRMHRPKAASRLCIMVRGLLEKLTGVRVMGARYLPVYGAPGDGGGPC